MGHRQEGVHIDRRSRKGPNYEGAHVPSSAVGTLPKDYEEVRKILSTH